MPAGVRRPRYAREQLRPGVVHLGVGNFHRAHQAVAIDDCLQAGDTQWGIVGVSLRRADMRDALAPQEGLYSLIERGERQQVRVIGALQRVLVAPESPAAVIAAIADPRVRLLTLTVTEKGYCLDASRRGPDWDHPDIAHDLANPATPRSVAGLVAAGLRQRRATGAGPLNLLSCDNLAANGAALRGLIHGFVQARDPALAGFVQDQARFPSSMVDRIVPQTTDALRADAAALLGRADQWPVSAEPFTQWLIEDDFVAARPELERSEGVELVADVAPFEAMKLRMLNAAHSCLAYLGAPAGLQTVDAAIAQPVLRDFVERLWQQEVIGTLPESVRARAPGYGQALIERFANPALGHRLMQIAGDGSQKLPQRVVQSLRLRANAGLASPLLAMAVAGWIRFLAGRDEQGNGYPIDDPLAQQLVPLASGGGGATGRTQAILGQGALFGDLAQSRETRDAIADALNLLDRYGTLGALRRL